MFSNKVTRLITVEGAGGLKRATDVAWLIRKIKETKHAAGLALIDYDEVKTYFFCNTYKQKIYPPQLKMVWDPHIK